MINVQREPVSPASLNSQEIRNYIDQVVQHLQDPVNNPKPDKPPSYRNSDLLEAFDRCFFSKCYITESKFANAWIMDIEHFIPQNERPDLVHSWENLFPCEHYTNMIKPRRTPAGGYLDPCDPNDNVEIDIVYSLSAFGEQPRFEPRDPNVAKAVNTCVLLNRVHNGHDTPTINATSDLRHAIHKKYILVLQKIIEWRENPDGSQEKFQAKRELQDLLSRRSSFTMLIRSMPAVRHLPAEFFD